ncbi:hypothetical protein AN1V17_11600 [Vallitalea sediminicola]
MLQYIIWSEWWNSQEKKNGISFDDYIPIYLESLKPIEADKNMLVSFEGRK